MKNIFLTLIVFIVLSIMVCPLKAYCEYTDDRQEIQSELEDMLADYDIDWKYEDIGNIDLTDLKEEISNAVKERIIAPIRLLVILITVIIFSSFVRGLNNGFLSKSSKMGDMICSLTAAAAILPGLLTAFDHTLNAVSRLSGFMLVFVPVFAGITIASGGAIAGGTYNVLIITASCTFASAADSFFMPVLSIIAALSISGSVFPEHSVDAVITLIKKIVTWSITLFMTFFTGFIGLRTTLAAKTDGAGAKTIKYMISGFVPIVGGAVSDAYSTVKGSFELIASTVGTAGCFAIAVIILPPIIELISFRVVIWISSAAAELFSADPIVKLLKGIDSGLAIAQCVLICYSVMLLICTGIMLMNIS